LRAAFIIPVCVFGAIALPYPAMTNSSLRREPIARRGDLYIELICGATGSNMPETRKNPLVQWAGRSWPTFLVGFGIAAVVIWVIILGWLTIGAVLSIF
jgi:hypothetical protein